MPTMEALERRIRSAEDLQSVVRTMKTLAAVSIRQYESAVAALGDYTRTLALGFRMLRWLHPQQEIPQEPLAQSGRLGCIVFGSDQGMCGSFNEQIAEFVEDTAQNIAARSFSGKVIWSSARGSRGDWKIAVCRFRGCSRCPVRWGGSRNSCWNLLPVVNPGKPRKNWNGCSCSTTPGKRRPLTGRCTCSFCLWIRNACWSRGQRAGRRGRCRSITMNPGDLYAMLIRQHLFVSLFRACAHSLAGENASRIASMQAAERNIAERLEEFRDEWRRTRQTSITEELLDVITGFETLREE